MRYLIFSSICLLLTANTFAYDWYTNPGSGTETDPFQISTPEQLMSIGSNGNLLTQYFVLMNDIVFDPNNNPAHVFTQALIAPGNAPGFTGTFDGRSYAIRNLKIVSFADIVGLFGTTTDAVIKNVRMENVNIISSSSNYGMVGGLIGLMLTSEVDNCSVCGQISGVSSVGGLVGSGGMSYWAFPTGQVEIPGGVIQNCSSEAIVTGQSDVGGLAGFFIGKISRCSSTATVQGVGLSRWMGGLAGSFGYSASADENIVTQCFSSGQVYGEDGSWMVGGFAGNITVPVYNSYSNGMVIVGASSQYIGGFAGGMNGGGFLPVWGSAFNCYSVTSISAGEGSTNVGVFLGYSGGFENCYFLDTSGPDNGYGTPLDDPNMMVQANFVGWDFVDDGTDGANNIWRMCVDGVDYPRLSWEFAVNGDFACGDGVDLLDLQSLAEEWLTAADTSPTTFNYACDANGDEKIDLQDFAALGNYW